MSPSVTWIGLFEVVPLKKNDPFFKGDKGGFANAVGIAPDKQTFKRLVIALAKSYGMRVIRSKDIDKFRTRIQNFEVDPKIVRLTQKLSKTQMVLFSTFHTYKK